MSIRRVFLSRILPHAPRRFLSSSLPLNVNVSFYDFKRFEELYNDGKKIRFPLSSLAISPFIRPEVDESDADIFEKQLQQHRLPLITAIDTYLGGRREKTDADLFWENTKHSDDLFIGIAIHPETQKIERYLLKFFNNHPQALKNARREVLLSYLLVECGLASNAPKIGVFEEQGHTFIVRRFYKGIDGRALSDPKLEIPHVPFDTLLFNYLLRYVVFGDLDFDNPGNIVFARHSSLTPDVIIHIDGEDIMPDENSMTQFHDSRWTPGEPIPGTIEWRCEMCQLHTPDRFFKRLIHGGNPLLTYMRRTYGHTDMMGVEIPEHFLRQVVSVRPWLERLTRTFDMYPVDTLKEGKADFQKTLTFWEKSLERKEKLTLFTVVCGAYT